MQIDMNPIILSLGRLELRWYGAMVALAILVVVGWTYYQVKKNHYKITEDQILTGFIIGTLSGIVGARLLHVIDYWDMYMANPSKIIGGAGLAIYGGILGAAVGLWIYSKFSKFNALYLFDIMAPGIALGQAIGRIGCLINGCCHGAETDVAWAVVYTNPNCYAEKLFTPYHPVQLYESIFMVLLAVILILVNKKIRFSGSQFFLYFGGYSVFRLLIGFIRTNEEVVGGLVQSQVIGIIGIVVCTIAFINRFLKYKANGSFDPELDAIENPTLEDSEEAK